MSKHTLQVHGASDDLIYIDGEEYSQEHETTYILFTDGTTITGINWRHNRGEVTFTVTEPDGACSDGWTEEFFAPAEFHRMAGY